MKAKEFRGMTVSEINEKIAELKTELFNLRFQHATNQLDNPNRIVEVKKDIARAKTVLREIDIKAQAQR
jgi:large subunit ribosomal protein L29